MNWPGPPEPMVNSPSASATLPTGVTTAAVPQANVSISRPLSASRAPLVDPVAFLADRQPFVAQELDQAVAGDAGQDRAGQRRGDHAAVVEHEEQVHAAQFLDPLALDRVEEHDLVVPLGDRLGLRDEAGGVVAAALGRPGAAGGGADVIAADPDRHRRHARLEIVARRAGDHEELVLARRAHAEERLGSEHEGPQVERPAIDRGKPRGVLADDLAAGLDEQVFGQVRHRQPVGRMVEPRGVALGTEQRDAAVGVAIGLQAFEDLLRIMQHRAGGIEQDRLARADAGGVPAAPAT